MKSGAARARLASTMRTHRDRAPRMTCMSYRRACSPHVWDERPAPRHRPFRSGTENRNAGKSVTRVLLTTASSRQSRVNPCQAAEHESPGSSCRNDYDHRRADSRRELAKTLFDTSSGMTRGGQICLVGPPIPASNRTDVTIGAVTRGVISTAAKPRNRAPLSRVHEASNHG